MKTREVLRWFGAATLLVGLGARAEDMAVIRVTPADRAAVNGSPKVSGHAHPKAGLTAEQRASARQVDRSTIRGMLPQSGHSGSPGRQDPADLQFHGGATIPTAVHHAVFVNADSACPANSCWGDPIGFLRDLNRSDFIHVTDQYVGAHGNNRYPVGNNFVAPYPVGGNPLTDDDMQAIAYAAAKASHQHGYGHIFHIFLKPGQDVCFDASFTVCASNVFCAYHFSFDSDIGHVIYSVEPFADVPGCRVPPGTPNGQLVDSTDDALSHESIEAITDPDGDAWWNSHNLDNFGAEIADECIFLTFGATEVFSDPVTVRLNGKRYAIQSEYSNIGHTCVAGRPDDD